MKVQSSTVSVFCGLVLALSFFNPTQASARETGLTIGNTLEVSDLVGDVTITCFDVKGGIETAIYSCKRETLFPAEFSRFQTANAVDADHVYLRAKHEDGSSRDKDDVFIGQSGRSKSQINLWVWSLFQRPLLEAGHNEVTYWLTKGGEDVQKGNFTVMVDKGATRTCPRGNIQSRDVNDCRSAAYACDRYFFEYNYCQ